MLIAQAGHKGNDVGAGLFEGIARGASQACVYVLEFQKTQLQVYGYIPRYTHIEWFNHLSKGLLSSTLTAGIVYSSYFMLYNQFSNNTIGGLVATLGTSIIKTPLANSMRILQMGNYPHVFSASRGIFRAQGIRGIYSGYGLSLADDYLDMEVRIRVYNFLRGLVPEQHISPQIGLVIGAISGSMAAAITTPFDAVRCHLAMNSTQQTRVCMVDTIRGMHRNGGISVFSRGIGFRASSNAIRTSLFCLFYELLLHNNKSHENKNLV